MHIVCLMHRPSFVTIRRKKINTEKRRNNRCAIRYETPLTTATVRMRKQYDRTRAANLKLITNSSNRLSNFLVFYEAKRLFKLPKKSSFDSAQQTILWPHVRPIIIIKSKLNQCPSQATNTEEKNAVSREKKIVCVFF